MGRHSEDHNGESAMSSSGSTTATPGNGYCPPSDLRVNIEAGLRSALSAGFAFLWLGFGPFEGGLSFFAAVASIVCMGNSVGQTMSRSLEMTHGAFIGALCAVLPRWLMQWGGVPAGAGFFVAVFLVLRSRRLTTLGRKFGCLSVTLLVLADISREGLTGEWAHSAVEFVRVNIEGGIFGLAASLLPYPRFATRDGALRAQFVCRSLSAAVNACVTGFVKGRDETSMSRSRLLCHQARHNLGVVRMELEWSRLELGLLGGGFCAGGMKSAEVLEELAELIEQVLQGVRGMRQSLTHMNRTRAQASFATVVGPALRGVAHAVDGSLDAASRRTDYIPAMPMGCCEPQRAASKRPTESAPVADDTGDGIRKSTVHRRKVSGVDAATRARSQAVRPSLPEIAELLEEAVHRLMKDYNTARREVLYGLDEQGRPLEENGGGASGEERTLRTLSKRDLSPPMHLNPVSKSVGGAEDHVGGVPLEGGEDSGDDGADETPNYVLVMQERHKLGSSATMARGAFLFSLIGLCADLTKKRVCIPGCWSLSYTLEAGRFVLSGLWKALRPPPGLFGIVRRAQQGIASCCCGWTRPTPVLQRDEARRSVDGEGGGGRGIGRQRRKGWRDKVPGSQAFWCFKVSLALTLCSVFRLSPKLDEVFEPAVWIPVTVSFVMESQSASAVSTSLLRLIGTVLGASYGITAAKLTGQAEDNPYGFEAYIILLPWVAVSCFFRNSSDFSYAAIVSGFTAVVVFTGSKTVLGADGEAVSLARIVNTVVGIVIYLFVDMLLVPTRARGLLLEQTYSSLDAALREVCVNGERIFGARLCARGSRAHSMERLRSASSSGVFAPPSLASAIPPPVPPSSGRNVGSTCGGGEAGEVTRRHGVGQIRALGATWGRLPAGEEENSRRVESADLSLFPEGDGMLSGESDVWAGNGGSGAAGGDEATRGELEPTGDVEDGKRRRSRSLPNVSPGMRLAGQQKHDLCLQQMVAALVLQKRYLPLAELEPQLWFEPFPVSAYHGMIAAQEELLRALTLMSRAAIAVSEDASTDWRRELAEVGSHLASLVQLMKVGIEDARDVFSGRGPSEAFSGWDNAGSGDTQGIHLLEVQAEALRLDSNVNADFVKFIQTFLERGVFPDLELESILRVSTAVISVMGLQKALLTLGHAVATVLDRESFSSYYR